MPKKEIRTYKVEMRKDEASPKITGYAAVFNSYSEEMWGFREIITPGAFTDALKKSDVRALINHDANLVLGRNTSGTLTMTEDDNGLAVEIDPPDTQYARDLQTCMKRGDIDQMSFAFIVADAHWNDTHDGLPVRTITRMEELFDVSIVTYPAYPATSADVRSAQDVFADYKPVPPSNNDVEILRMKLELKNREVI